MATNKTQLTGLHVIEAKCRTYYYAWRGGPRMVAEPGTDAFVAEFVKLRAPKAELDTKRFATWVTQYKTSDKWKNVSDKTKRTWAPILDSIQKHFGELPASVFSKPEVRKDIKHWRAQWRNTPRMADVAKQVLSCVCAFMVDDGAISINPCTGIENLYDGTKANRSEIIWPPEDMATVAKAASPEVVWAMKFAALSGIRKEDLFDVRWDQVGDLAIVFRTAKSGGQTEVTIPLYAKLRELLAEIPRRADTVLTSSTGKPWSSFGSSWKRAMAAAGLQDRGLHFHDLRGTAATNFYRAGFTSQEIADALGWKNGGKERVEALINKYVKRDELLKDRIRRMDQFQNEKERLENDKCKTPCKTDLKKIG